MIDGIHLLLSVPQPGRFQRALYAFFFQAIFFTDSSLLFV